MINDPQLHQLFEAESAEHLSKLDDGLLRLETDLKNQQVLDEVFREAHSLKGAARMLGLYRIETAAHYLESNLNSARKGESQLTADSIDRLTIILLELRKLVHEALEEVPDAINTTEQLHDLPAAIISPAHTNNAIVAGKQIRDKENSHAINSLSNPSPSLAAAKSGEGNRPLNDSAKTSIAISQTNAAQPASEPFRIETVRVETRKLDDLLTLTGELSVIQGRVQHRLALIDELSEQWTLLEHSRRKFHSLLQSGNNKDKTDEILRKTFKSDGEMLTLLGSRIKKTRDAFYEDGARLDSTVNTLAESVNAVRLVPLSVMFSLFPRMVRDLAKEQHKEVELVIVGAELNVDKRILEEMKDPLMHLLRNAIDHGIELPEERERLGKPRASKLRLSAVRESNNLLIKVSDDGLGLDIDAIRQTALQQGLYDAETLANMPGTQLKQLIFLPGFSTSAFVTELSGRGVGLDVVRVNVEHLKGDIRLESVPNQGMDIQLRLPLGLSTTRLMLVSVENRIYGLPIESIFTSTRVSDNEVFTLEGRPAIELDGQALIAPRLADLLGMSTLNQSSASVCVVIQLGDERLGLRVDDLLSEEEVLTKPLGAPLRRVRNVSGMALLGSGEICAVLNPLDLLRTAHQFAVSHHNNKLDLAKSPLKKCILLAEDSMLVRVMEKRILEDAGYEVVAAVDGEEAFTLIDCRHFSAIVSDINMPNMDGLALTSRIRREEKYHDLPIILVTSLASDDDKRRGLEAGANAYISKPTFDQRVLLETLKRLIVP